FHKRSDEGESNSDKNDEKREIKAVVVHLKRPDFRLGVSDEVQKNSPADWGQTQADGGKDRKNREEVVPSHGWHAVHRQAGMSDGKQAGGNTHDEINQTDDQWIGLQKLARYEQPADDRPKVTGYRDLEHRFASGPLHERTKEGKAGKGPKEG